MDLTSISLETITLEDQTNYRLMEIGKIEDYFNQEIQYQKSLTIKLSKYLTFFDYTKKILTVILTVFSPTNNVTHVKSDKILVGLITSVFPLITSLSFGVVIKLKEEIKLKRKTIIDCCI